MALIRHMSVLYVPVSYAYLSLNLEDGCDFDGLLSMFSHVTYVISLWHIL